MPSIHEAIVGTVGLEVVCAPEMAAVRSTEAYKRDMSSSTPEHWGFCSDLLCVICNKWSWPLIFN